MYNGITFNHDNDWSGDWSNAPEEAYAQLAPVELRAQYCATQAWGIRFLKFIYNNNDHFLFTPLTKNIVGKLKGLRDALPTDPIDPAQARALYYIKIAFALLNPEAIIPYDIEEVMDIFEPIESYITTEDGVRRSWREYPIQLPSSPDAFRIATHVLIATSHVHGILDPSTAAQANGSSYGFQEDDKLVMSGRRLVPSFNANTINLMPFGGHSTFSFNPKTLNELFRGMDGQHPMMYFASWKATSFRQFVSELATYYITTDPNYLFDQPRERWYANLFAYCSMIPRVKNHRLRLHSEDTEMLLRGIYLIRERDNVVLDRDAIGKLIFTDLDTKDSEGVLARYFTRLNKLEVSTESYKLFKASPFGNFVELDIFAESDEDDDPIGGDDLSGDDGGDDPPADEPDEGSVSGEDDPDEDGDDPEEDEDDTGTNTNDAKGVELVLIEGDPTIDLVLFRREIKALIDGVLSDPSPKLGTLELATLASLRLCWLNCFPPASIIDLLARIGVKVKIKVSSE